MAESEEFGSVLEDTDTIMENREIESLSHDFDEELESVAGCECNSQCTRKLKTSANGKVTGCPCKGNGLRCGGNCSCGTKKKACKNKVQDTSENHPDPESDTRPVDDKLMEEMLEVLDYETLLKVAKKGFMSRGLLLKDLIASAQENSEHPSQQPGPTRVVPPFCVCSHCYEMPTDKERLCCKERRLCRSKTAVFQNVCIDSDNLGTVIRSLADTYVFTPTYDNRAMRHAAYRQYVMWQHGHLGKGNRRVIPSCCVSEIRKHYPSPNSHYTGYKDK